MFAVADPRKGSWAVLQARRIILTGVEKSVRGQHAVALRQLLTPRFLTNHTTFSSLDDMIGRSPGGVTSAEAFISLPSPVRDGFISRNSNLPTWDALVNLAVREYANHSKTLVP